VVTGLLLLEFLLHKEAVGAGKVFGLEHSLQLGNALRWRRNIQHMA
jgi:hypothetical protein